MTPSQFFLLFTSTIIFLRTNSSARTLTDLNNLQEQLLKAKDRDRCLGARTRAILAAEAKLNGARQCQRNNFSYSEFLRLRSRCKTRISSLRAMNNCRLECAQVRSLFELAQHACRLIQNRKIKCASVHSFEEALQLVRSKPCPENIPSTFYLERMVISVLEKRRKRFRFRKSPYNLTVLEPRQGVADSAIIVLNGLGMNVSNILPIVRATQAIGPCNARYIIPQAPTIFVSEAGKKIPAWYNIIPGKLYPTFNKSELLQAVKNINSIVKFQYKVYGIPPERVLVFGVSQGASVALSVYLRHTIGAVISSSGFLPFPESYPREMSRGSANAPALIFHGSKDERILVKFGRASRDFLRKLGRNVTYVEFEGGTHTLERFVGKTIPRTASFLKHALA